MTSSQSISLVLGIAVLAGIALVGGVVFGGGGPPEGPVAAVWDKEACAYCKMHVGEPAFAAQLQTKDGEVWFFDDPGCLFEMLDDRQPEVHALYFHDYRESRWLSRDEVGFVRVSPTPMGFGIAAVAKQTPGAMDLAAAHAIARAKRDR